MKTANNTRCLNNNEVITGRSSLMHCITAMRSTRQLAAAPRNIGKSNNDGWQCWWRRQTTKWEKKSTPRVQTMHGTCASATIGCFVILIFQLLLSCRWLPTFILIRIKSCRFLCGEQWLWFLQTASASNAAMHMLMHIVQPAIIWMNATEQIAYSFAGACQIQYLFIGRSQMQRRSSEWITCESA